MLLVKMEGCYETQEIEATKVLLGIESRRDPSHLSKIKAQPTPDKEKG